MLPGSFLCLSISAPSALIGICGALRGKRSGHRLSHGNCAKLSPHGRLALKVWWSWRVQAGILCLARRHTSRAHESSGLDARHGHEYPEAAVVWSLESRVVQIGKPAECLFAVCFRCPRHIVSALPLAFCSASGSVNS